MAGSLANVCSSAHGRAMGRARAIRARSSTGTWRPHSNASEVLRDAGLPRVVYRRTWERLVAALPEREACQTIVGLLGLAADGHEPQLAEELGPLIELDQLPDLAALTAFLAPRAGKPSAMNVALRLWPITTICSPRRRRYARSAAANGRLGLIVNRVAAADDQAPRVR